MTTVTPWSASQWLDWMTTELRGADRRFGDGLRAIRAVLQPTGPHADTIVTLRRLLAQEETMRDKPGFADGLIRTEAAEACVALERAIAVLAQADAPMPPGTCVLGHLCHCGPNACLDPRGCDAFREEVTPGQ